MTTPASPAPAASPAPGGGMPAAAPAAGGSTPQPKQPDNLVAQGAERRADAADASADAGKLTPDEETRLGELLTKRDKAAAGGTVRLRVEGGHESVQVGHVVVGRDWTDVPVSMVGALTEGAADAGVKITQDESES